MDIIIDCFAGGGGASVGIEMALGRSVDIAINHDPEAIRMLKPSELKIMQGFPEDYIIDRDIDWKPYPLKEQVARIGNSVVPVMAQKLVEANCPYLIVGKRTKNLIIDSSEKQLKIAI